MYEYIAKSEKSKPTRPQVQRVIDYLINRRDNNDIPAGVERGGFDNTIATLRDFIIDDRLSSKDSPCSPETFPHIAEALSRRDEQAAPEPMQIEIKQFQSDPSAYDLVVNGAVQVEAETMGVCEAVRSSLLGHTPRGVYTEADEIADNISRLEEGEG